MLFPNKQNSSSPEYKQYGLLKIISMVALGVILIGFFFGLYFIYQNIFKTLGYSQSILLQKVSESIEVIDFDKLERVTKSFDNKMSAINTSTIHDPFFGETPTPTSTTTTVR